MNIKKAINTKTLLIPSLALNAALLIAVAHFGRELGDLTTQMATSPSVAWSSATASGQRDAAAPAARADVSPVPVPGAQAGAR